MATKPSKSDLADSVQIALDAADTATGVTEEFNSIKEQFEVVNIQAKRIHQSVTIIFVSAISAAIISLAAGFLMYYLFWGSGSQLRLCSQRMRKDVEDVLNLIQH